MLSSKRVLVAIEDKQNGEQLYRFIASHDWAVDTEFTLVHVVQPPASDGSMQLYESLKQDEKYGQVLLDQFANKIKESLNVSVTEKVAFGYIAEQLKEEANRFNADLLIVGSHGKSAVSKWFFGSVSEVLLSSVSCPVIVIRPTRNADKPNPDDSEQTGPDSWSTVLIAAEDSSQSRALFEQVISHKWANGTRFTIMHVVDQDSLNETGPHAWDGAREKARAAAQTFVQVLGDRLRTMLPNCSVNEVVTIGTPSKELLEYAALLHADLLVVGSHGRTGAAKWFLGSVSQPLLAHAPCAVVVVRPSKALRR